MNSKVDCEHQGIGAGAPKRGKQQPTVADIKSKSLDSGDRISRAGRIATPLLSALVGLVSCVGLPGEDIVQVWVDNRRATEVIAVDRGVFDRTGESFVVEVGYVIPAHTVRWAYEGRSSGTTLLILDAHCTEIGRLVPQAPVTTIVVDASVATNSTAPAGGAVLPYGSQTDRCVPN